MTSASLETASKVIGDAALRNIATFKFKPKTLISQYGGVISITAPNWYVSTRRPLQMYQDRNFQCLSDSFTSIKTQRLSKQRIRGVYYYTYQITYDGLQPLPGKTTSTMETDEMTIKCTYWRNPIRPEVYTGFNIQTMDSNLNIVDVSSNFQLDATAYTPFQIPDSSIKYTIPNK